MEVSLGCTIIFFRMIGRMVRELSRGIARSPEMKNIQRDLRNMAKDVQREFSSYQGRGDFSSNDEDGGWRQDNGQPHPDGDYTDAQSRPQYSAQNQYGTNRQGNSHVSGCSQKQIQDGQHGRHSLYRFWRYRAGCLFDFSVDDNWAHAVDRYVRDAVSVFERCLVDPDRNFYLDAGQGDLAAQANQPAEKVLKNCRQQPVLPHRYAGEGERIRPRLCAQGFAEDDSEARPARRAHRRPEDLSDAG